MIKNYIEKFKDINPVYLIDFSISDQHVLNELKKRKREELEVFAEFILKNAVYFKYKKVYRGVVDLLEKAGSKKKKEKIEKLFRYALG